MNKKVIGRWEDDGNEDNIERTEEVKKKDRNEEDRRKRKLGVGRRHKKNSYCPLRTTVLLQLFLQSGDR